MKIAPSLPNANTLSHVGEILLHTLFKPQVFSNTSKTMVKNLPKEAMQQSAKLVQQAWDSTTESVSKHLRAFHRTNAAPIVATQTEEQVQEQKQELEKLNTNFQTKMLTLKILKDFDQIQAPTPEAVLEKLKTLHDELAKHLPPPSITLGEILAQSTTTTEAPRTSEIQEEPLAIEEQINTLETQIKQQLDVLVPQKKSVVHQVTHSSAPSWLALLLDSTYEPNYIEKLATLIHTFKEKGLEGVTEKFIKEAEEYSEKPLDTITSEATFKIIPDTSAYLLADAASMFLGVLSVVRGNQERREANHEIKHLQQERTQLKQHKKNNEILNKTLSGELPHGLYFNELLNLAKLDRNKRGIEAAKLDKTISISAMGAGSSSALKGLSDITIKTGLAIKSFATGHGLLGGAAIATKGSVAGLAATASGAASTIALGPLAGLFAVGLGAAFTRKTSLKLSQLNKDFDATKQQLNAMHDLLIKPNATTEATHEQNAFNTYKAFIEKQGHQRVQFFSRFKTWNKAFLVGAGLYTASSAVKAGVIVAALLGATAVASNPVGWGVLTGVGIAAAIGLGISTLGFIKGHVRQTRYNQQTAGDHALVDRHFLVNAQNFNRPTPEGSTSNGSLPAYWEGMQLAANNLEMLNTRASLIETFLNKAAEGTQSISPFSNKLNVLQRLRGKTLGKTKINEYLVQSNNFKSLIGDVLIKDIEAQQQHIQRKLNFRDKHQGEHLLSTEQIDSIARSEQAPEAMAAYEEHLTHMANKAIMDTTRLHQLTELNNKLKKLQDHDEMGTQQQTDIKKDLLKHWGVKVTDKQGKPLSETKIQTLFAKHIVQTQRKEVDMAKGVLFEAQLQARHMNNLSTSQHAANSTH